MSDSELLEFSRLLPIEPIELAYFSPSDIYLWSPSSLALVGSNRLRLWLRVIPAADRYTFKDCRGDPAVAEASAGYLTN